MFERKIIVKIQKMSTIRQNCRVSESNQTKLHAHYVRLDKNNCKCMTTSIVWHFQCQFRLLPQKNLKKYMMNCITKRVTMMILETFTTTQSVNVHKEINRLIIMIRTIIYTKNKSFCLKTSMVCPMFRYQH